MQIADILLLAVGLSMDAFAVAVCKGLALKKIDLKNAGTVGLWFGGFQALMPLIGYFIAALFADSIKAVDHWVAFVLLSLIGGNMIREAFSGGEEEADAALSVRAMLPMAVATSIDAMAVGVTFAFTGTYVNIWVSVMIIGVTTCLLSMIGVKVGSVFGARYEKKAEILGGVILILLGLKILLEHLGVL
ncbi:MAG: manganese efflux pump [Clostridia bacterium]|nr:manganese efflux pump [Clostridia bacterium]